MNLPPSTPPAGGGAPAADPAAKTEPGETPAVAPAALPANRVKEIGGPPGPEPTRYGDWQFNGRVTDF
jgi:hypothetical protein